MWQMLGALLRDGGCCLLWMERICLSRTAHICLPAVVHICPSRMVQQTPCPHGCGRVLHVSPMHGQPLCSAPVLHPSGFCPLGDALSLPPPPRVAPYSWKLRRPGKGMQSHPASIPASLLSNYRTHRGPEPDPLCCAGQGDTAGRLPGVQHRGGRVSRTPGHSHTPLGTATCPQGCWSLSLCCHHPCMEGTPPCSQGTAGSPAAVQSPAPASLPPIPQILAM